jgi:hypothetical protein
MTFKWRSWLPSEAASMAGEFQVPLWVLCKPRTQRTFKRYCPTLVTDPETDKHRGRAW